MLKLSWFLVTMMNILIHESCFGLSNIQIIDSGIRKGATVGYCWLILADFLTYLFIIVIYLSYCDHILQSTTRCSIHQNSPFALYQVQKGRSCLILVRLTSL